MATLDPHLEREIDSRISHLDAELRALRLKRNKLIPPISRLPPELLCRVFQFCQRHTDIQWIYVTHLCHVWRTTALAYPNLWTYIQLGFRSPFFHEMLFRAGSALPLSISGMLTDDHISTIQSLPQYAPRLREVSLTAPSSVLSIRLAAVMAQICAPGVAPLLEHLGVSFYEPISVVPAILLLRPSPGPANLSELILENCILPWDVFVPPPSLTALEITFTALNIEGIAPYVDQIVAILQRAPQLANLVLKNAIGSDPSDAPTSLECALNLQHLTTLHIESSVDECVNLLDELLFPALLSLTISCHPAFHPRQLLPHLKYWAHITDANHAISTARLKCIHEITHDKLVVQLYPSATSRPALDLRLRVPSAVHSREREGVIAGWVEILTILPLSSLICLSVHDLPEYFPNTDFLAPFTRLDRLAEIAVHGECAATALLSSLVAQVPACMYDLAGAGGWRGLDQGSNLDLGGTRMDLYPALETLRIEGCGRLGADAFAKLVGFVKWRRRTGQGLPVLRLEQCERLVDERMREALRDLVGELVVT
ncbi:hypothetical protein Hypma_006095 [Hypsizygus marmoreus]|uniref:F-box domain-containing protein n=1 Tax=Hypsizygus marmoreus TaxID=39966 RepID=A0A369K335_HYPMA|nr:hypothetical protein Hypma_006095 [Hypsizygus marmoreus]